MDASQFVKTDRLKIAANMFIQSNQLNEKISQLDVHDPGSENLKDQLIFSRVYSTPDKRHEEIINLLKNIRPQKIELTGYHSILDT
jgi:hypothetical protein